MRVQLGRASHILEQDMWTVIVHSISVVSKRESKNIERVVGRLSFRRSSPSLRVMHNDMDHNKSPDTRKAFESAPPPDSRLFVYSKMMAWHDRSWRPTLCFFPVGSICLALHSSGWKVFVLQRVVLFRSRASSGTQTNHIWRSFWYFGLIFQRRLFPRKWKRVRREFGNVCFLFGSNDYGIPRFFAESLTTDSCKCHARCLLRCDTKVAGQRKIKGRDDIGLGNFDWAKVSRPWGEERRAVVFTFPLPWLSLLLKSATVPCSKFSSFHVWGHASVRYVVAQLTNTTTVSYYVRLRRSTINQVIIESKHLISSQLLINLDLFNCYEIKIY